MPASRGDMMEADEKLANALLPYLESFDESALSNLGERLKGYGIKVSTSAVEPGPNVGPSITFTKQSCTGSKGHAAETDPGDNTWDLFYGMLNAPGLEDQGHEIQIRGASLDMFEVDPLLSMCTPRRLMSVEAVEAGGVNSRMEAHGGRQQAANAPRQADDELETMDTEAAQNVVGDAEYRADKLDELYALLGEGQAKTWLDVPWSGDDTAGSQPADCDAAGEWRGDDMWRDDANPAIWFGGGSQPAMTDADAGDASESEASDAIGGNWNHTDGTNAPDTMAKAKRRRRDRQSGQASASNPGLPLPRHHEHETGQPLSTLRTMFGTGTRSNLSDKVLADLWQLSAELLRPDLIDFLHEALPRWQARGGLWQQEQLPVPLTQGTGQARLFTAYSCICKLDARMGDDQIRNRVAVVMLHSAYELACTELRHTGRSTRKRTTKGRGDASAVIDSILARLHDDWDHPDRKAQLRNRFHDKKRYGKRWLILTRSLGPGVLLVCSPRIASLVQNTAFTVDMLTVFTYCVQHLQPRAVRILDVLNKSAPLILHAVRNDQIVPAAILDELRPLIQEGT